MRLRLVSYMMGLVGLLLTMQFADVATARPLGAHAERPTRLDHAAVGTLHVLLQAHPCAAASPATLAMARVIITSRIRALGVSHPQVSAVGKCELNVVASGVKDQRQFIAAISADGDLVIYGMGSLPALADGAPFTNSTTTLCNSSGEPTPCVVVKGNELDSSRIAVSFDSVGQPQVNFSVKGAAVQRLSNYTSINAGGKATMAIVLDGKVILDASTESAITDGSIALSGIGSVDKARAMSFDLKYAALPFSFRVVATMMSTPAT